jgi:hypothetical protein
MALLFGKRSIRLSQHQVSWPQHKTNFVEKNLYGYLGDLKDQALERISLDWKGLNEVDIANSSINIESLAERKSKIERGIAGAKKAMEADGYEVIEVDL